ncbi:MAG: hypothetical protein ABI723_25710 [Bacteroidia bacterium]
MQDFKIKTRKVNKAGNTYSYNKENLKDNENESVKELESMENKKLNYAIYNDPGGQDFRENRKGV